jgi:hypothetical protein
MTLVFKTYHKQKLRMWGLKQNSWFGITVSHLVLG